MENSTIEEMERPEKSTNLNDQQADISSSAGDKDYQKKAALLLAMQKNRPEQGLHPAGEDAMEAYEELLRRCEGNDLAPGVSTGLEDVDMLTRGFQRGKLYILGGPPGMGKTSMAMQMAVHAGLSGVKVAYFNMDMVAEPFIHRMISYVSGIPVSDTGILQPVGEEWNKIREAVEHLKNGNIYIDHTESRSAEEILLQCLNVDDLGIIFVDWLQMIKRDVTVDCESKISGDFSVVCEKMKNLAELLNVPVVCLSSMPILTDRRNKRPCLSDFDEFGAIVRYADVVIGIYRDYYYHKREEFRREAEVIVLKSTMHGTGQLYLRWDPKSLRFEDIKV